MGQISWYLALLIFFYYNLSSVYRLSVKDKNIRTEPKHIVFLSQLLLLFKFCHICKAEKPTVERREIGKEAVVKTSCNNPECIKQSTWYSQPLIPGSHIPAGNFLLCLCILLTGGSATKVHQMFKHMSLGCVSLGTIFKYQRVCRFVECFYYYHFFISCGTSLMVLCIQWYSIYCDQAIYVYKLKVCEGGVIEWCRLL